MVDTVDFDQKWLKAKATPRDTEVNLTPRHIEISLPQVLDRYVAYLETQVDSHSMEKGVCDELCQQVHNLRNTIAGLDASLAKQVIV